MNNNIIEINEEKVKDHLGNLVRETVEETLNAMLEAEADQLVKLRSTNQALSVRDIGPGIIRGISIPGREMSD